LNDRLPIGLLAVVTHPSFPDCRPNSMLPVPLYQQSHQSEVTVSSVMAEQSLLAVGPTSTRQRFTTNLSIVMTIIFKLLVSNLQEPRGRKLLWAAAIPANTEYSRIFAGVMSSEYLREIFREYSLNIATLIRIFANIRSGNVQRIFTKNIQGMFFVLCPGNIYEKYSENIP